MKTQEAIPIVINQYSDDNNEPQQQQKEREKEKEKENQNLNTSSKAQRKKSFSEMVSRRASLSESSTVKYTILYSHGNGEDLGMCRPVVKSLAGKLKMDVVAYDYLGYGYTGTCSEANTYASAESVFLWMVNEKHIPPENIIL